MQCINQKCSTGIPLPLLLLALLLLALLLLALLILPLLALFLLALLLVGTGRKSRAAQYFPTISCKGGPQIYFFHK